MLGISRQHLQFAIRQLRRNPGFACAAIMTLAIGIGATTAVFSLVNGILLRRLPFPDSDQLVAVDTMEFPEGLPPTRAGAAAHIASSYPNFFDWRDRNHTFQNLASCSFVERLFSRMNGDNARVIPGARVSANLFSTLGVSPALGRWFTPEEERPGHRVVILSYELWVSDFASSPNVIGVSVRISDEPSTIVGVAPKGFHFPVDTPAYFWATFAADAEGAVPTTSERGLDRLSVIGRMKPGVAIEQARADLNTIQASLAQAYPENRSKVAVSITPLLDESTAQVRTALRSLLAAVTVLLLISSTNVAGILLIRINGRRPELALRTALGAGRSRILGQLLLESLLLAVIGAAFGVVFACALLQAGLRFIPHDFPRLYNVAIDGRVLALAILLSALTSLIFGLLPAWRVSQLDPVDALHEGAPTTTGSTRRSQLFDALVVIETALSFCLLVGAGLFIRTVVNVLHVDPGFDQKNTAAFDIALTQRRYPDPSKVPYFKTLIPQLAAVPGVERVSAVHPVPISWPAGSWASFTIPGQLNPSDVVPGAISAVALPGYFETLSIPLLRGRTFAASDNDPKSPAVAVINEDFAHKYFSEQDPIGRYFIPDVRGAGESRIPRQIVGIVGNTRTSDLWNPYQPEFFLPYAQAATHQRPLIVMKVAGDPAAYQDVFRRLVAAADPDAPLFRFRTFAADFRNQAVQPRFEALVLSVFASIALLLSTVGLYALLSYMVVQRTRELGLRMALGLSRTELLGIVVTRGMALALIGIGAGILTSFYASRLIRALLFKVSPVDATVFSLVSLVLLLVSFISALVPALRAASIDPMRCLREE